MTAIPIEKVTPLGVQTISVPLGAIRSDQSAQPRDHLNTETTKEYADAMTRGDVFPPLSVFFDGEAYWLADGFHRHYAALIAGLQSIACEVRPGGLREAILHSCGANATHGNRRSNEDKRRAVRRMLEDEEWRAWSDSEIARRCNVTQPFVGKVRHEMAIPKTVIGMEQTTESERTFTHHKTGKLTTMNTANIKAASSVRGPRLNLPEGVTASDQCRAGLALERDGVTAEVAAERIGIGVKSYRLMRDIVLLADRSDLSRAEAEQVRKTIKHLDDTAQPSHAHTMIKGIADRVWGETGRRLGGADDRRVAQFDHAIHFVTSTCIDTHALEIPHLTRALVDAAIRKIVDAEAALRDLKQRIEETRS